MRMLAALMLIAAGFALYGWGLGQAPPRAYLVDKVVGGQMDAELEHQLAEAYWRRYPDVAANDQYGRNGPLALRGAIEHYTTHGRREGRVWGR